MATFRCDGCGHVLRVKDEMAGRKAQCPKCKQIGRVQAEEAAAPVPPTLGTPGHPAHGLSDIPETPSDSGERNGYDMAPEPTTNCSFCSKPVPVSARMCVHCGKFVDGTPRVQVAPASDLASKNPSPWPKRVILLLALAGLITGVCILVSVSPSFTGSDKRDLAKYRAQHPTTLTRHGPPPKAWQTPTPLTLPAGVDEITYDSGGLKLKAWVSRIPQDGRLHPAIVFCHGGFWFGDEDWEVLQPFLDAGFVVMAPRVRAENGNPGEFEYYYGEVDDVVAAGRYLAGMKGIDKSRVFVSGHSAGGDLAALAVMVDNPFAMSAPIGAVLDMRKLIVIGMISDKHGQLVVFNPDNLHEVESRSAVLFTSSLRSPIALFHGRREASDQVQKKFVALAQESKREASLMIVEGDHGLSLVTAIPKIIEIFRAYDPKQSGKK